MHNRYDSAIFGINKTTWAGRRGSKTWFSICVFRDYLQPWHVLAPKNHTIRVRGPKNQYFFWVQRRRS